MFQTSKTVKTIFYINVIMFIATLIFPTMLTYLAMYNWNSDLFRPWQLITHQFLHGGFLHILFNMLVFLSFGSQVEANYGSRNMWIYYLSCGIGGAILHCLMTSNDIPVVGASGAIWGVVSMFTLLHPNEKMYFFFIPYGIKAKYLVTLLFLYELYSGLFGRMDNVAHFGHIGGAIVGVSIFLLHKYKVIGNKKYKYS